MSTKTKPKPTHTAQPDTNPIEMAQPAEETSIAQTYVDLSNLNPASVKAVLLKTPNDILQMCANHPITTATAWDQTASAMACVVKWSPGSLFTGVVTDCTSEGQTTAKNLQGIAYLGLAGLLAAGKAITEINKAYVMKRWKAYCEGSSITN